MPNEYDATADSDEETAEVSADAPRTGKGKMDEDELAQVLEAVISDAEDYVDNDLAPDRNKATDYYKARPFGNEEEGRSQFVLSEVRDGVTGVLPSLIRIFTGSEHVVEFVPKTKASVETARLMTDAVRNKFELNGGFLKLYSVLLDGLVRKIGTFMWGWEEKKSITEEEMSGLTLEDINALTAEEGVEVVSKEEAGELEVPAPPVPQGAPPPNAQMALPGMQPPMPAPPPPPTKLYKVRIRRTVDAGDVFFDAVPPSELVMSREARDSNSCLYIGRRMKKTRGELLAMGYTDDEIDEHMSLGRLGDNEETDARNPSENSSDPEAGEENDEAVYHEGYIRLDYEGDGIDVFKVCALGNNYHPLHIERADEVKLAIWSPFPEPHTLVGDSLADRLMDLQLLKSSLARGILDSLSASIFPRMAYIEGQVNPEDILNTEIGGPIRVKNTSSLANALMPVTIPFAGREGLSLLEYADGIKESRTGRSNGPDGLDQDALQSTEKAAAKAAVSASQMSTEMMARVAAEMVVKPLFRGLMREMVRHRPQPYMTKAGTEWIEVDPRSWMADLDVQVNIALGSGTVESKLGALGTIITRLTALMATGPENPIATWVELRNALATEAEILGHRDTEKFYKPVTPEQLQQMAAAAAAQPPQPSPEQMLAEGQIKAKEIEVEGKLAIERDRLTLDEKIAMMTDDRERDKNEANAILARMKIESEFNVKLNQMEINAATERDRLAHEQERFGHEQEMAGHQRGMDEVEAAARLHEVTLPEPPAETGAAE